MQNATIARIPNGWRGVDIGPTSINMFTSTFNDAKTVIWIGSIGAYATDGWPSGTEVCVTLQAFLHNIVV